MDTLQKLKKANALRCVEAFKHTVGSWTPTDWACAVAGETGELCNLVKKWHRGDLKDNHNPFAGQKEIEKMANEAADIVIYLDLFCQKMGIDLDAAIRNKFNYTSHKMGVDIII